MKTLDLIPPETATRREALRRGYNWMRRLGLAAALVGLAYASLGALASLQDERLEQLTTRYRVLDGRLQSAGGLLTERSRLVRNYEGISLLANDLKTTDILRAVGSALPPESYLSFLQIDRGRPADANHVDPADPAQVDPAADEEGGRVRVRGFAPGHGQVGDIIKSLITSGVFSEVRLVWTRDASAGEAPSRVEFQVECSLAEPAAVGPRAGAIRTKGGV